MPTTQRQRQPVCPTAFPNHNSNTQTYGATILEGYGMQGFEGLVNIADGQYYELDESQHANQVLDDGKFDAWSRDSNAVSGGREDNAQSKLPQRSSVPIIWCLGSSEYREGVAISTARPTHPMQNL